MGKRGAPENDERRNFDETGEEAYKARRQLAENNRMFEEAAGGEAGAFAAAAPQSDFIMAPPMG